MNEEVEYGDTVVRGDCPTGRPLTVEEEEELLAGGGCGCDRPRRSILPCGHCGCGSACDGCQVNPIWRQLTEWEQDSWCGCEQPGKEVLPCGHCGCGDGLCWEWVNVGPARPFERRRKASCA